MKIELIRRKSERNSIERGLPFDAVVDFVWDTAIFEEDARLDYSETRFLALGYLGVELHVVCFTAITGGVRVISLRRASRKERRRYAEERAPD